MSNTRTLLAAFVVALTVALTVHLLEFPGSVPDFEKESGGGVLLDARPSFSEDAIYGRIEEYGERGRTNYAFRNATVDTQFLFLSLPFAYVVFDLAENGAVLVMLAHYPERLSSFAAVLPYLTVLKRGASLFAIAIPLVILTFVFFRRRTGRAVAT